VLGVTWSVHPEPRDEAEREALLAALDQALAEEQSGANGHATAWWRAGFDDLSGGPTAEQAWREPGVVEP
jgi:hypothetical protein